MELKRTILALVMSLCALFSYPASTTPDSMVQETVTVEESILPETSSSGNSESAMRAQQQFELEKLQMQLKFSDSPAIKGIEAGIWIVTITMVTAVLALFVIFYFINRSRKAKYELMMRAIEMGKDIPAEFFEPKRKKRNLLEDATTLIAVGLGFFILAIFTTEILFGVGAICLLIGIGNLIVWKVEGKKKNIAENPEA